MPCAHKPLEQTHLNSENAHKHKVDTKTFWQNSETNLECVGIEWIFNVSVFSWCVIQTKRLSY